MVLSGQESQRLRTIFTSNVMEPSRDLDAYGRAVMVGVRGLWQLSVAQRRACSIGEAEWRALATHEIYRKSWYPTRVPIFSLVLLSTAIHPSTRAGHLAIARWLIDEARVPIDCTDVSGTTALHHAISTKPFYDPEYAQILYDTCGNVSRRNHYGGTAAHELPMVWDAGNPAAVGKACDALRWFLAHGGNLNIRDGDRVTARMNFDVGRACRFPVMTEARKELWRIADEEDKR